jgi:AraC family ethanolamine operon transcriptional activator
LRSYVDLVLQIAAEEPAKIQNDALRERIESDLLLRVDRLMHSSNAAAGGLARERKAFALVRSVERFMWEHVDEPLTLQRICMHTGCRMRSLIYSFKDAFGVGPISYLKILRLNAAHRRLRN